MKCAWQTSIGIGTIVAIAAGWFILQEGKEGPRQGETAALMLPDLSPEQQTGRALFDANCTACHGQNALGSDRGPPLLHRIYEPSHHSDLAFLLAVRKGVRAHHWKYGNMPAIDGISDNEVVQITAYVRALQRANGIN